MNKTSWPLEIAKWNTDCIKLLKDVSSFAIPKVNSNDITNKSQKFPIKFPITTVLTKYLTKNVEKQILDRNIQSTYPIIHEHALNLCAKFLNFKRQFGSKKEQNYYKDISLKDLIQRLLDKRAVSFLGASDNYLLLDKTEGRNNWESIGTNNEQHPLILENCLSYDEIKLSALLSVSSYSYFINDGNRFNKGIVEKNRSKIQEEGIIIGLIGTRFEVNEKMECQEIIISKEQNVERNGYGESSEPSLEKIFAEFYEKPAFIYNDKRLVNNNNLINLNGVYFDIVAYEKRLSISFDTVLVEANHRAKNCSNNKSAYIHIVGIGLGVWKISHKQTQIFMDTFGKRLKYFGANLSNVSDIHFAYISGTDNCLGIKNGELFPIENHPNHGFKIHISKREPFTKLSDPDKLLVVSYAWDGNALPGNEFWLGDLTSTGDTSTACSTQITELHNPHINPLVCADNLQVVMLDATVQTFNDFILNLQQN